MRFIPMLQQEFKMMAEFAFDLPQVVLDHQWKDMIRCFLGGALTISRVSMTNGRAMQFAKELEPFFKQDFDVKPWIPEPKEISDIMRQIM